MTQFETLSGQPSVGYHDLQRRAELRRKTARRIRSEFLGENAKHAPFSLWDFCRETLRLVG